MQILKLGIAYWTLTRSGKCGQCGHAGKYSNWLLDTGHCTGLDIVDMQANTQINTHIFLFQILTDSLTKLAVTHLVRYAVIQLLNYSIIMSQHFSVILFVEY